MNINNFVKKVVRGMISYIGKEYFINGVDKDGDRISYWITADNNETYGYWTFETGGFYRFGTLKEWRKQKLNKINEK